MTDRTPFEHPTGSSPAPELLIVANRPEHRETALAAAAVTGVTIVPGSPSIVFTGGRSADIVIVDIRGCDDASAEALLIEVDTAARAMPLAVIVAIEDAQIDIAVANIFGAHVAYLVEPTIIDFATALAQAAGFPEHRAREGGRETERLRRLNQEVARIADALAKLARDTAAATGSAEADAALSRSVRDQSGAYGAPPAGDAVAVSSSNEVRRLIRARRMRGQFFDPELFADPAWDMLIDLYAAQLEGGRVSVSSLCIAAAVPGTTALRWISSMTEVGLFERHADASDRRRAFIGLTGQASAALTAYFAAVRAAGHLPG